MDNDTTNNDMLGTEGEVEEVAPAVEGEEVASEESSDDESFDDAE